MSAPNLHDTDGAMAAIRAFIAANTRGDLEGMKALLTRRTLEGGGFTGPQNPDAVYTFGEPVIDEQLARVTIPVTMTPADAADLPEDQRPRQTLPAIMVIEDGAWKFDLFAAQEELMKLMDAAMSGLAQQMGDAMSAIGEGLAGAFASDDQPQEPIPDWLAVAAAPGDDELRPLPDLATLARSQATLSEAAGREILVRADVKGLVALFASDELDTMHNWLDDQIVGAWLPALIERLNDQPELPHRLHGVRIEAVHSAGARGVYTDLSELVYRMDPRSQDGYYAPDEVIRFLTGALNALPPVLDTRSLTHTALPDDVQPLSLDAWRATEMPRIMRRISELAGRPIRLTADWPRLENMTDSAPVLARWCLNRVVGGLATALREDPDTPDLRDTFSTIRIEPVNYSYERELRYQGGELVMRPGIFDGEKGGFDECDIAFAFRGSVITPEYSASSDEQPSDDAAAGDSSDSNESSASDQVDSTDAETPDEPDQTAAQLNDENFRSARESIDQVIPSWQMQLEMATGRTTPLRIDWDSLNNDYALVRGLVHICVADALSAFSTLAFQPGGGERLRDAVNSVVIAHRAADGAPRIALSNGELRFELDASSDREGLPDSSVTDELRALISGEPQTHASPAAALHFTSTSGQRMVHIAGEAEPKPDRYARAAAYMDQLESVMKDQGAWPGDPPPGEIEVHGAFGCENMAFQQWLAWVLIPRVRGIIHENGDFPSQSQVGAYAVRELDGYPGGDVITGVLSEFDQFINRGR